MKNIIVFIEKGCKDHNNFNLNKTTLGIQSFYLVHNLVNMNL